MRDLWAGFSQWLNNFFNPKYFIKTTKGKVGRVESHNKKTGTLSISFGSFNSKGKWVIKNIVTISDSNIHSTLNQEQCARELAIITSN